MSWWSWKPQLTVAQRRQNALREIERLRREGVPIAPVLPTHRKLVTTFWGLAWCKNVESYKDYEYRLPRGRSYVLNCGVIDLQIQAGSIRAVVSGSKLYDVDIQIKTLGAEKWSHIQRACSGKIATLVDLLRGQLRQNVMELVTNQETGLFPSPDEIQIKCSCPDWAAMCKHAAAVMYGVGVRLDEKPEMLFALRNVDHLDLIAGAKAPKLTIGKSGNKTLSRDVLGDVFGIEFAPAKNNKQPPPEVEESEEPGELAPRKRAAAPKKKKAKSSDLHDRLKKKSG